MSYIGYSHAEYHVAPPFIREVLVPDGSATYFDLANDVPGYQEDNIMVMVNNVVQEPLASYSIINDATNRPRRLDFAGTALLATDSLYVVHKGTGTLNITPATGSVTKAALADNLVSHVVNKFLGSQATGGGSNVLTLTEAPTNADSISVYINGVYQRSITNYTVAGSVLTFTSALSAADQIDVHHHTIRGTVTKVPDGYVGTTQLADLGVTSGKLETNIAVAGTLGVTGLLTATGNLVVPDAGNIGSATTPAAIAIASNGLVTIAGNLTVSGTTTTVDTTLTISDAMVVNNAGTDVGLKVNSTSTGNIMQLQDNATDVLVVADGGHISTGTSNKIKQRGEFLTHTSHRAWVMGS